MNNPSKNNPKKRVQREQDNPRSSDSAYPSELLNQEISAEFRQVIQDLPEEKQILIRREILTLTKSHSGPLPSAETIQGFEDAMSGAANRVFLMAEKEQDHRIGTEKTIVRRQLNQSSTGQWMAFTLAVLFLGAGVFLGFNGHDELAGAIVSVTLIGLVAIFVTGKYSQQKSQEDNEGAGTS